MELATAIEFATEAHHGQVDKQGVDYIHHPLRVMETVRTRAKRVAVLHDVFEDTDNDLGDAIHGLGLDYYEALALWLLTRWPEGSLFRVTYREYIQRIADDPGPAGQIAREVKIADIEDNLGRLTPDLHGMEKRYAKALEVLA